jgi:hypothetical protein
MGPFTIKTEGMLELVLDRLHDLADSREPAPQGPGPWRLAMPLGRADDLCSKEPPPYCMVSLPLKTLVDDIRASGGSPKHWPGWGWRRRAKDVSASG